MARGNSKGIRRDAFTKAAIEAMEGEPFTASDLIEKIKETGKRNTPSVREVGMVLAKMKRLETIRYIGEAAGLTQTGVRKTALYIAPHEGGK